MDNDRFFSSQMETAMGIFAAAKTKAELDFRASSVINRFFRNEWHRHSWSVDIYTTVHTYNKECPEKTIPPSAFAGQIAVAYFNGYIDGNLDFLYQRYAADALEKHGWKIHPARKRLKLEALRQAFHMVSENWGELFLHADQLIAHKREDDYAEICSIDPISGALVSKEFEKENNDPIVLHPKDKWEFT